MLTQRENQLRSCVAPLLIQVGTVHLADKALGNHRLRLTTKPTRTFHSLAVPAPLPVQVPRVRQIQSISRLPLIEMARVEILTQTVASAVALLWVSVTAHLVAN